MLIKLLIQLSRPLIPGIMALTHPLIQRYTNRVWCQSLRQPIYLEQSTFTIQMMQSSSQLPWSYPTRICPALRLPIYNDTTLPLSTNQLHQVTKLGSTCSIIDRQSFNASTHHVQLFTTLFVNNFQLPATTPQLFWDFLPTSTFLCCPMKTHFRAEWLPTITIECPSSTMNLMHGGLPNFCCRCPSPQGKYRATSCSWLIKLLSSCSATSNNSLALQETCFLGLQASL